MREMDYDGGGHTQTARSYPSLSVPVLSLPDHPLLLLPQTPTILHYRQLFICSMDYFVHTSILSTLFLYLVGENLGWVRL